MFSYLDFASDELRNGSSRADWSISNPADESSVAGVKNLRA